MVNANRIIALLIMGVLHMSVTPAFAEEIDMETETAVTVSAENTRPCANLTNVGLVNCLRRAAYKATDKRCSSRDTMKQRDCIKKQQDKEAIRKPQTTGRRFRQKIGAAIKSECEIGSRSCIQATVRSTVKARMSVDARITPRSARANANTALIACNKLTSRERAMCILNARK